MVEKTTYTMRFRRRKEGKTDYRKRLAFLLSDKPRLVVRMGNNSVIAQIVRYNPKGDEIIATAKSGDVKKLGYAGHGGNAESAYLTGMLCAARAKKAGVSEAVLDIGLHTPVKGSNVFAALKGALDGGMEIPHSEECFPTDARIKTDKGTAVAQKIGK